MTQQVEYHIRPAAPHEWHICLALVQEILSSSYLPEIFFVAHEAISNKIIALACTIPKLRDVDYPGFPCFIRVLSDYSRMGIGQTLVKHMAKYVSEWDVPYLLSWESYAVSSPQHAFLSKCGFKPYLNLYGFEVERDSAHILMGMLDRYLNRNKAKNDYTLAPFTPKAMSEEVKLYSQHFLVSYEDAYRKLESIMKIQESADLSASIYHENQCLGFIIGLLDQDGVPKVDFWVTQKNIVHSPVALILLSYFVKNAYDMGFSHARFDCNDKARSTLNVAKRLNARTIMHAQSFALSSPPSAK